MSGLSLLSLSVLLVLGVSHATKSPKTVCYYESWVHWRTGPGFLDPKELDPTMCTHSVYSYFGIEPGTNQVKVLDPWLMENLHDMEKFVANRGHGKALFSVGGAAQSAQFSLTASSDSSIDAFASSVMSFVSKWGFDGLMIDWADMRQSDATNFVRMLQRLKSKLSTKSLTLGVTLPATVASMDYYDMPSIAETVDFVNILSIDYNGPWNLVVGHAAPFSEQLRTLEEYHKRGAPKAKLVMAVPFFARTWKLLSIEKQSIGDSAASPGQKGPYTQVEGLLSYNELCVMIKSNPSAFSLTRDPSESAVYAVYNMGSQAEWISFEDSKTLAAKAANITTQGYAGMSVYALSNEDVHGLCGEKNPLLHAINAAYVTNDVTEPTLPTDATRTTAEPVTVTIPGVVVCHKEGYVRDPVYCFTYYHCVKSDFGTFEKEVFHCDRTEAFDEQTEKCVDRNKVPGC